VQIVVNHVTRMRSPRVCVAGIEQDTLTHVRPTTPPDIPIPRTLLRSEGGPFGPGALVDLGEARPASQRPEVEDHRVDVAQAQHIEDLPDERYLDVLESVKHPSIAAAFGADLCEIRSRKFAVPIGRGQCSLAVLQVKPPRLYIAWEKLFLDMTDSDGVTAQLRVTDARFYEPDQMTIRTDLVHDVRRRLAGKVHTYAMLGLAHAIHDDDGGDVHWLQCNGVCLADRPVGDSP
jgi:hypothetical protein